MVDCGLRPKQLRELEQHAAGFRINLHVVQQNRVGMLRLQFLNQSLDLPGLLADRGKFFQLRLNGRRSLWTSAPAGAVGALLRGRLLRAQW
jgi:hypothetical protein